ncbi:MAG: phosphotransferase family protein [Gammaproteobacteria bacterium]|nr:phosphotransferase family protein [Gammaproteobacteria bacterium]
MTDFSTLQEALEPWLAKASSARKVTVTGLQPLTGGAIQENWRFDCTIDDGPSQGSHAFVLRCDAPSAIASSLSKSQEYAVLQVAFADGIKVPEPLWLCDDPGLIGRSFYIMRLVEGMALGPKVVKDQNLGGNRNALAKQLAHELVKIHAIRPPLMALDFLEIPDSHPAMDIIHTLRHHLDNVGEARPVLEWGLRWAELHLPKMREITLTHQDFRTGNYLIDSSGLRAILDWEFAAWGDPMSDIGWFCAECWRFSRPDLEAGGICSRTRFYQAYEEFSQNPVDQEAVRFWELIAHIRWAVIALQQAHRYISGGQQSLELALTAHLLPELEIQILNMTSTQAWDTT